MFSIHRSPNATHTVYYRPRPPIKFLLTPPSYLFFFVSFSSRKAGYAGAELLLLFVSRGKRGPDSAVLTLPRRMNDTRRLFMYRRPLANDFTKQQLAISAETHSTAQKDARSCQFKMDFVVVHETLSCRRISLRGSL